jgi:16S rRNA (uracil1498-N3)-methyltransferase
VASIDRDTRVVVALTGEIVPVAEPPVRVTLAIGILKGDHMDTAVRDATMLGASALMPIAADHVAVPARAWRIDRWQKVAIASAKQCGRATVPVVARVTTFADLVDQSPDRLLMAIEPSIDPQTMPAAIPVERPSSVLALVGPEGGWSAAELRHAQAKNATFVSLGPRTLRAESAPAILLAACWTVWGWS